MSKYLELFKGSFNDSINEKTKPENKPYIGYSLTDGIAYTIVPAKDPVVPEPEQPSLYEAVDLGLPSGLKWANMNVGATSPEDYGMYFQWGDTVGYTKEQVEAGEKVFNWDTYFDTTDGGSTFNKYAVDKLTVLESEDDAATTNMGSDWRMPTIEDVYELINETIPTFIDLDGNEYVKGTDTINIEQGNLKGIRFTGSNGNSIFIPAAGYCKESLLGDVGKNGILQSSILGGGANPTGRYLYFNYEGTINETKTYRCYGLSVRGVHA